MLGVWPSGGLAGEGAGPVMSSRPRLAIPESAYDCSDTVISTYLSPLVVFGSEVLQPDDPSPNHAQPIEIGHVLSSLVSVVKNTAQRGKLVWKEKFTSSYKPKQKEANKVSR